MPELPEVEVVRRGLEARIGRARVAGVEVLDARALTRHPGPAEDFAARLVGARLSAPRRRGKFLWIPLADRDEAVLIHLGMSGQVLLGAAGDPDPRHLRVRILLDGGRRVDFADQRTFGSLAIDALAGGIPSQVRHIALDPLDPAFGDRAFLDRLARRRTAVKRALLDQTLVSGIGNIYADEALWGARIHPEHPADALSRPRARALLGEVRAVMERALAEGGTTFDSLYVNVNGQSGYFSRSLRAYGQQGRPCARCGRPIARESFMNRGSHFCPRCQRVR